MKRITILLMAMVALSEVEITIIPMDPQPVIRNYHTICVAVDSMNNIWVGTWNYDPPDSIGGVSRFDGSTWEHWNIANTGGDLLENDIFDIEVAPDGTIWIATGFDARDDSITAVLYYFDPADERWHRVGSEEGLPGWWYRDVEFDSEGNVWASNNVDHIAMYDGHYWHRYEYAYLFGYSSGAMLDFCIDETDHLWGNLWGLDTLFEFREVQYNSYWLDTTGVGIISPPPPPPAGIDIYNIITYSADEFYIAVNNGVHHLSHGIDRKLGVEDGFPHGDLRATGVAKDSFGDIWCTFEDCIVAYNGDSAVIMDTTSFGIPRKPYHGIAIDRYDRKWITGLSNRIILIEGTFFEHDDVEEGGATPNELAIKVSPNPFNAICKLTIPTGFTAAIYNIHGRKIHTLSDDPAIWNAEGQPSGVYLVRAQKGDVVVEKRVVLVK